LDQRALREKATEEVKRAQRLVNRDAKGAAEPRPNPEVREIRQQSSSSSSSGSSRSSGSSDAFSGGSSSSDSVSSRSNDSRKKEEPWGVPPQ